MWFGSPLHICISLMLLFKNWFCFINLTALSLFHVKCLNSLRAIIVRFIATLVYVLVHYYLFMYILPLSSLCLCDMFIPCSLRRHRIKVVVNCGKSNFYCPNNCVMPSIGTTKLQNCAVQLHRKMFFAAIVLGSSWPFIVSEESWQQGTFTAFCNYLTINADWFLSWKNMQRASNINSIY